MSAFFVAEASVVCLSAAWRALCPIFFAFIGLSAFAVAFRFVVTAVLFERMFFDTNFCNTVGSSDVDRFLDV